MTPAVLGVGSLCGDPWPEAGAEGRPRAIRPSKGQAGTWPAGLSVRLLPSGIMPVPLDLGQSRDHRCCLSAPWPEGTGTDVRAGVLLVGRADSARMGSQSNSDREAEMPERAGQRERGPRGRLKQRESGLSQRPKDKDKPREKRQGHRVGDSATKGQPEPQTKRQKVGEESWRPQAPPRSGSAGGGHGLCGSWEGGASSSPSIQGHGLGRWPQRGRACGC